MGRVTTQQVRVFTMFAVAFVMTGLCSTFAHRADNALALMTGLFALVLIVTMFTEVQRGK